MVCRYSIPPLSCSHRGDSSYFCAEAWWVDDIPYVCLFILETVLWGISPKIITLDHTLKLLSHVSSVALYTNPKLLFPFVCAFLIVDHKRINLLGMLSSTPLAYICPYTSTMLHCSLQLCTVLGIP